MELSQRPTSTYSNVEPSKDTSIPINYNKDFNYQNQQFDKQKFDQGFNSQPQLQQQLPQQQQGLIGSLAQNQQIPAPPSSNFNQNLSQQQSIHIPVQSASQGGNVQPSIVPASQSQGHAPQVTVPTAIPNQSSGTINETNLVSGSNQEYGSLITKLKTMIFGYESDYTNDPSFNAPLTLPSGIKTSITEIPDQLKKMLLEKEPTFDRDLPTKDFFKDLPEKEIIRHRVVHPVQVQTIMHTVVHPPKKIEIRHAAPHEVVHEVVHEIPHEIHHVVQHHVPFEVHHIVEHQVHDNVKHVMRHGVHQMVNHEIKEEIKQNIFHGINRMLAKGPVEAEIAEDNKIPHSVSRTTPFINQNITEKLLEDFSIGQGMKGIDFSQGGMKGIDFSQGGMNQGIQSSDSSLYSNLDKGKGILPGPTNTTVTERTVVDRSV